MKKAINKNLKAYQTLDGFKKSFMIEVMKETGWGRATFFNRLSGSLPPSPFEQKCLDVHFEKYENLKKKLNQKPKAYASAN